MSGFVSLRIAALALLAGVALTPASGTPVLAQSAVDEVKPKGSGLPVPRFVSLKSGKVNSRIGPGVNYPVDWLYLKSGLPMEVIQEFDNWRRVRDSDGAEGWINQSLLSGRRSAIAAPWQRGKQITIDLLSQPNSNAHKVAIIQPGSVGTIKQCNGDWCEMAFSGHTGWLNQSLVWGAYPGESIKD